MQDWAAQQQWEAQQWARQQAQMQQAVGHAWRPHAAARGTSACMIMMPAQAMVAAGWVLMRRSASQHSTPQHEPAGDAQPAMLTWRIMLEVCKVAMMPHTCMHPSIYACIDLSVAMSAWPWTARSCRSVHACRAASAACSINKDATQAMFRGGVLCSSRPLKAYLLPYAIQPAGRTHVRRKRRCQ